MDLASVVGIVLGIGAILFGNSLEGGQTSSLIGLAAGIIVLGGTLGAVMLQFPFEVLTGALAGLGKVFDRAAQDPAKRVVDLEELRGEVERDGTRALLETTPASGDPFFSELLAEAAQGADPDALAAKAEAEIEVERCQWLERAEVWRAAGLYAPLVAIIGVLLGAVIVLSNLDDINAVGHGAAASIVSLIYGVGATCLVCLPVAGNLRLKAEREARLRRMTVKGVLAILRQRPGSASGTWAQLPEPGHR